VIHVSIPVPVHWSVRSGCDKHRVDERGLQQERRAERPRQHAVGRWLANDERGATADDDTPFADDTA